MKPTTNLRVVIRKRPSHRMAALTIGSSLVLSTLASQDGLPVGKSAQSVPSKPASARVHESPNLLLTTLAVDKPLPHNQYQWPTPKRKRYIIVKHGSVPGTNEVPEPPVVEPLPFNQSDWPDPVRRIVRTAPIGYVNLLQNTLAPVLTVQPFSQSEWSIPRPVRRPNLGTQAFYVLDDSSPFKQTNWPIPVPAVRSIDRLTWTDRRNLALTEPPKPFPQTEWPNPPQKPASIERLTWTHTRALVLAEPAPPFTQTAWPNPRSKAQSPELTSFVRAQGLALVGDLPLNQADWPNPVLVVRRVAETWTRGLLDLPQVSEIPFLLTEHPNPQPLPRQTLSWIVALQEPLLQLLEPTPPYPVQHDWPVFRPTPPSIDHRTFIQGRATSLEDQYPFHQDEWPVPPPVAMAKGLGWVSLPQLGILGFPATPDVIVLARADVGIIEARPDQGSVEAS